VTDIKSDPVMTALRGRDNFKLVKLPWADKDSPPVRLQVLSDYEELTQIARAQAWCQNPGVDTDDKPIGDDALIGHVENTWLLWYALRHPEEMYPGADEHKRLYATARDLQQALGTEQVNWLVNEYGKLKAASSPFSVAAGSGRAAFDKLLAEVREKFNEKSEKLLRFKLWWSARHGVLPTEDRFRQMTDDQWWLLFSVTPNSQLAEIFPEQFDDKTRAFLDAPVDGGA